VAPSPPQTNAKAAIPVDAGQAAMADKIAHAVGDEVLATMSQSASAASWRTTHGTILFQRLDYSDYAVEGATWPRAHWSYRTPRLWPTTQPAAAVPDLLHAVADVTSLDAGDLGIQPQGSVADGKVVLLVQQPFGGLEAVAVGGLTMTFNAAGNFTTLDLIGGILSDLTDLPALAPLQAAADSAARACLLTAGFAVPSQRLVPQVIPVGNHTKADFQTHDYAGRLVEEFGFAWDTSVARPGCSGVKPLAVLVDVATRQASEVRVSPRLADCLPD